MIVFTVKFSENKVLQYQFYPKFQDKYDDENKEISKDQLSVNDFATSFAKTIHSSQGSEYKYVVLYIPRYTEFLTLELLYTGITRPKKVVWLLTTREILNKISTNPIKDLPTNLNSKIKV